MNGSAHNGVAVFSVNDVNENGYANAGLKFYPVEVLRNVHHLPANVDPAHKEVNILTNFTLVGLQIAWISMDSSCEFGKSQ